MTTTFFKNLFNTSKTTNAKAKDTTTNKESQEPKPLPPERRLSISKSGKMKRKNYGKQISVKDASFFDQPPDEKSKPASARKISDQVDNIDDVIEEMLKTVENSKS